MRIYKNSLFHASKKHLWTVSAITFDIDLFLLEMYINIPYWVSKESLEVLKKISFDDLLKELEKGNPEELPTDRPPIEK